LTTEIGQLKQVENKLVLDSNREQIILDKTAKFSHSPQLSTIYKTIMDESKSLQRK
jgi:chorismate mutase